MYVPGWGKTQNHQINPDWLGLIGAARLRRRADVIKSQCQTILLHTSFQLGFNVHIITFPPMNLEQFRLKSICWLYLFALSCNNVRLWVTFSNRQGAVMPSEVMLSRKQKEVLDGSQFQVRGCWGVLDLRCHSPGAGASRRRWRQLCSSRWSRRKAAPSRYSASRARTRPETHTGVYKDRLKTQSQPHLIQDWCATYRSGLLKLQYVTLFISEHN